MLAKRPRRRCGGRLNLLGGLSLMASLGGCTPGRELPNVVYLAIGANQDQTINSSLRQEFQERLGPVEERFRQLHPDTRLLFGLYPEDRMVEVIHERSQAGLGSDLLFVNGDTALRLLQASLVDPCPVSQGQLSCFNRQRQRSPHGPVAGPL